MLVLAENGDIEKQIRYDAFGNVTEQTGTFTPRYTFSTKEYLSDAGLYLYAYRAYDPIAGRWTQRDPIDYQDSINLYQFCGNNPVNNVDVLGLALYAVFVKGHSRNPFGHVLIGHIDDKTGKQTYYDINVKPKGQKGHKGYKYTRSEFIFGIWGRTRLFTPNHSVSGNL